MTNVDEVHERPQKQARLLAEDEVTDDPFSKQLTWRMDPETSFSDWTLQVSHDDSILDEIDTYHVHKVILAVGPRRSEYFANCFVQSMQEQVTNTTKFTYSTDMAGLFPLLLDYIYNVGPTVFVHPKQAIGIYKLADYFQIRGLAKEGEKYLDEYIVNMSMDDLPMLFHELVETESLLKRLTLKLSKYVPRLTEQVACKLPIDILLNLIEQARINAYLRTSKTKKLSQGVVNEHAKSQERNFSALIVGWLEQNRDEVTPQRFQDILGILLQFSFNEVSALRLLLIKGTCLDDSTTNTDFTPIQKKCIKYISRNIKFSQSARSIMNTESDLLQRFSLLPKHILCHILARSKW